MPHIPILRMKSLKTLPFPIAAAAANAGLFALSNLNKLLLRQNLVRNLSMLRGGGEGESPATLTQEISSQDNDPWITVGGGAVNEKKRMYAPDNLEMPQPQHQDAKTSNYDPISVKSHLWHALEGMDRYPNYLARWPEEDIDLLEESLKIQLEKVRQQRSAVVDRRDKMRQLVQDLRATAVASSDDNSWDDLLVPPTSWDDVKSRILDPRMQRAIFTSKMFDESFTPTPPALSDVLNGNVDVQLDIARLTDVMDEELPDVFSLPLLNLTFIKRLRDFIIAISHLGSISKQYQYLLVGRRPIDLDAVGLSWLNDLLFHLIIRPISRHLFQSTESLGELDWRHGFIAGYSAHPTEGKPRERLVTHTDDAEVTLNLCLGDVFEGGHVEFRGLRGTYDAGKRVDSFEPQPGLALLHAGRHFHDVTPVTKGDRFALIIWSRSWSGVRASTCPCCWLNRRQDNSCVCGPTWN